MRVAEAEEEDRRRRDIAAAKQVLPPNIKNCSHLGSLNTAVLLHVYRQRRSCSQRPKTPSPAIARSRADIQAISRPLSSRLSLTHTVPECRQEQEAVVFSKHHSVLKEQKITQLQEKLQARRKGV